MAEATVNLFVVECRAGEGVGLSSSRPIHQKVQSSRRKPRLGKHQRSTRPWPTHFRRWVW